MNNVFGFGNVNESLSETATAFETMQKTLLVFCGLVAVSLVIVSVAIYRQSK